MFDHWLLEEMQAVCASMGWPDPCPNWSPAPQTRERFGVHSWSPDMGDLPPAEGPGEEADLVDEESVALEEMLEQQRIKSLESVAGEYILLGTASVQGFWELRSLLLGFRACLSRVQACFAFLQLFEISARLTSAAAKSHPFLATLLKICMHKDSRRHQDGLRNQACTTDTLLSLLPFFYFLKDLDGGLSIGSTCLVNSLGKSTWQHEFASKFRAQ